jgi:hypothetical protein
MSRDVHTSAAAATTLGRCELWLAPLRGITPAAPLAHIATVLDAVRAQTPAEADEAHPRNHNGDGEGDVGREMERGRSTQRPDWLA